MQALLDFFPVVVFFAVYLQSDMPTAVMAIMVAVIIQIAISWIWLRKVNKMTLISAGLVLGFGGISLALKNELVFMWKPTVLNWLFALVFLGSRYIGKKTIIQRIMQAAAGDQFKLKADDWQSLNTMWVAFFVVSGAANIYVAYNFSEATWVNFKLFGLLGMTVIFMVLQGIWLTRCSQPQSAQPDDGN